MSCHVLSCHAMSCHVMSFHVLSCHVMPCHVVSCHALSCHVVSCLVMSCYVMSRHVMSRHARAQHVASRRSRHVTSCRGVSCCVVRCRAMPCHIATRHDTSCHGTARHGRVMSRRDLSFHLLSCYASRLSNASCRVLSRSGYLTPCHIRHVMSFLIMEKAGKVAVLGRCVINTSKDEAKQEKKASDSSVKRKICVSAPSTFWYCLSSH